MSHDTVDVASMFPPQVLRQYALLADGERGALIGPQGDIAWMCAPRWHSDAVFATLIGGGGAYVVTPAGSRHVWGGYYEHDSLIWRSRWITTDGIVECREALAYPGDAERVVLLRRVVALRGDARVRVLLEPRARFGHYANGRLACRDGVWTGRTGPLRWRWTGAADALPVASAHGTGEVLVAELLVPEGEQHDLVFEVAGGLEQDPVDPDTAWQATEATWARRRPDLRLGIAERDARHAWAVLRGLTSSGGGMVAAATMSLPERAGAGRSYDYRYAWIRDQSYAGIAAATAGATDLLEEAAGFITARLLADGPEMKPAYTVTGDPVPSERELGLPGYPGGADKVGNWVNQQFQLDAFGEALQLLATAARLDLLDADGWRAVEIAVDVIGKRWPDAEAGIWELDDRCWTQSRLACVAGLRAVARLPGPGVDVPAVTTLADTILARTAATSLHPDGYWQRSPDQPGVDASLLLPPVRGGLPADDPRTRATLLAVHDQLVRDCFVYRFRHDERDLGDAEGAFLLCGLMLALAEHQQGRPWHAARCFERNRAACGPAGLFSEEYDVTQRQLRGNLPQAFVHALLLQAAATLTPPDGEPDPL